MILSTFYVAEERRNPEFNPKFDIISSLAPYQYDPNAYITFSSDAGLTSHIARGPAAKFIGGGRDIGNTPELAQAYGRDPSGRPLPSSLSDVTPHSKVRNGSGIKVGINPNPMSAETPVGVYSYPLREVWDDLVANALPYARQKPFVVLLRSTGCLLDLSTYSEGDLSKDVAKLAPIITHLLKGTDIRPEAAIDYWIGRRAAPTPGAKIWAVTRGIAEFQANDRHDLTTKINKAVPAIWNALLRSLGYGGVDDRGGESVIHSSEPTQTVFLSPKSFEIIEAFDNRHPMHIDIDPR